MYGPISVSKDNEGGSRRTKQPTRTRRRFNWLHNGVGEVYDGHFQACKIRRVLCFYGEVLLKGQSALPPLRKRADRPD